MKETLSSAETLAAAEQAALTKTKLGTRKTLVLAALAGAYIAMGGTLSLLVGYGFAQTAAGNPGLQKLLSGTMFPLGLILVVLAGAELFTGNNAVLIPGALGRRYPWKAVARNWALVYLGNFAGALLFAYFFVYLTGVAASEPWNEAIRNIALAKVSMPWHVVLLKGIGANWLVCLAVWLGMCSRGAAGKILGLWFPVMCFVAIGYEHSIANMFFIPLGMMQGAEVGWGEFIGRNLIPATLGNIAGGAVFVGGLYWYVYGTGKAKE
ncbi:formate/nitrite transporter family protein [uncultured Alistipes sp.]|jgi:formate/nitrite transporter|uniref:formate/nitrite transporter family protein n=1 Tax=uncultured Alistipes sp. TaxID=538949 RepID=UPI00259BDF43|nr:formate/nitrite transporter family protein [uncultured Alistipes sp.]